MLQAQNFPERKAFSTPNLDKEKLGKLGFIFLPLKFASQVENGKEDGQAFISKHSS